MATDTEQRRRWMRRGEFIKARPELSARTWDKLIEDGRFRTAKPARNVLLIDVDSVDEYLDSLATTAATAWAS